MAASWWRVGSEAKQQDDPGAQCEVLVLIDARSAQAARGFAVGNRQKWTRGQSGLEGKVASSQLHRVRLARIASANSASGPLKRSARAEQNEFDGVEIWKAVTTPEFDKSRRNKVS